MVIDRVKVLVRSSSPYVQQTKTSHGLVNYHQTQVHYLSYGSSKQHEQTWWKLSLSKFGSESRVYKREGNFKLRVFDQSKVRTHNQNV